jgi:hypothetical protein
VLGYEYGSSRHAKSMDVHEAPAYRQRTVLQQAISVGYRIGLWHTVQQYYSKVTFFRGDVGVVSDRSITSIAACRVHRADPEEATNGPPPPRSQLPREIPIAVVA